jgi:hypothetical protein
MTIRDDIEAVLQADGTLTGLLTGGIHAGGTITRQDTPGAFDANIEVLPCALINIETEVQSGPYKGSTRAYMRVFFYQRSGYDVIDQALARVFTLLNRQKIGSKTWEVRWADDVRDQREQALGCSLSMSRYEVIRNKS